MLTLLLILTKVEPSLLKAEPSLLKVEPSLLKADSCLLKAEPSLLKAEPSLLKPEPLSLLKAEPSHLEAVELFRYVTWTSALHNEHSVSSGCAKSGVIVAVQMTLVTE